jgi:hypothetical protein
VLEDREDKKDMSYQQVVHLERISLVHISYFHGYHLSFFIFMAAFVVQFGDG